ncbi:MAG: hypothetical protein J0L87_12860 [Bacteroidetes bacterium]|nr:hypothetical protein [Bacteroidota bacterium]
MTPDIFIPFSVRFSLKIFTLPSVGKLLGNLLYKIKDQYVFLNFALKGIKDELIKNKIQMNGKEIKKITSLKKLLSVVGSSISENESQNLLSIKENVMSSIATIDEILLIIKEKEEHKELKQNLFNYSELAINSHLTKYSKAI